jgi:dTDP-4-amino-4,6-dideoxy-D-glucose ammonia-lyase
MRETGFAAIRTVARPGSSAFSAEDALMELLRERGEVGDHHDETSSRLLARGLVGLARIYGSEPFVPLETALRKIGAPRPLFARMVSLFSRLPELRAAVTSGPAGKYWTNTILPLEASGVLDTVLRGVPALPHRLGLYPGPTCMFRCHFCVRVTGARYAPSELAPGNELLASVIDEMPADDPYALYISGGLEPLTNPALGELVSHAAARRFRLTMYSNAFALTEAALARQQGLWDLDAVRVSLYGLSDDEYLRTTGKAHAFQRVRDNLHRFQRLRAARNSPLRLGLSYLVLPGRAERLLDLVDFIAGLDHAAPDRPVDFLTLRQDYSGRPDGNLSTEERSGLHEILHRFERKAKDLTPLLDIDFGYALQAMRMGVDASLLRIGSDRLRPRAHPQVAAQIDIRGDVYLYREAGFPSLPGSARYIVGRVGPGRTLREIIDDFVLQGREVEPAQGDEYFMDGYDQVVTARLNQMEADYAAGWGDARGFLR